MRVTLLNDSFPPVIDGVVNVVMNYARIMKEQGLAEPMVGTPRYPDETYDKYPYPVIPYQSIDTTGIVSGYRAGNPFASGAIDDMKAFRPDVIHSHCPVSSTLMARMLREETDAPIIFTYHTKFDVDIARAVKAKFIQKESIKTLVDNISACDEIWVVSNGAGENLKSLGYEGRYRVMPNGVDFAKGRVDDAGVREATKEYDLPEGVPVFLFVGRIIKYKGLPLILDCMKLLKEEGMDFRMVFAGGGQESEEIKTYCSSLRLDDKVIFLGPVYDRRQLSAWYCRADLFLFPSDFDTNGLVVREAAACSLPAALIKGSCAAEGVTHMKNGFLIEESAASLAVLLATAGQDRRLLEKAGQAAADELYISWPQAIDRAIDRYMTVIENYRSGKYPEKKNPVDDFFQFQGTLMDLLSQSKLLEPYL